MSIAGAWVYEPRVWPDERGTFHEVFKQSAIKEALGRDFVVRQVNQSHSRAGTVRGLHWADTPPGQAKYVQCIRGRILDFLVDLREGSPSFGKWDATELSEENNKSLLISSGLGHGFIALEDDTIVSYLCDQEYSPGAERGIRPTEDSLGLPFSTWFPDLPLILSKKDLEAPTLKDFKQFGRLPRFGQ
jgi:dTDP-4-dehydrorhamnose 3,5-epimerase